MKSFEVYSGYGQFYVADAGINPAAPEEWTEEHLAQRHNTLRHIAALCPEGDISARIIVCGPDDEPPSVEHRAEFEVETSIEVPTGRIGVYGWPSELCDEYRVEPGAISIRFTGHHLDGVDDEQDYYVVQIRRKSSTIGCSD